MALLSVNYSKREVTKEMTGEIRALIGEVPPMGRSIKIRIMVPYWRIIVWYSWAS